MPLTFRQLGGLLFFACASSQINISLDPISSQCSGCDMSGPATQTRCSEVQPGIKVLCSVMISLDIAQNSQQAASASARNASLSTFASATASAAVSSTPSRTKNATSTKTTYPPYIRPSKNNQACDIYGPVCQTGSVTVGLNATTPTSTVVPCSDYLRAQAVSVFPQFGQPFFPDIVPEDWHSSFGRSPQCTSFAKAFSAEGPATFSNCNNASQTLSAPFYCVPPGVNKNQANAQQYRCCGNCQIHIDEVRITYFPEHEGLQCKNGTRGNVTAPSTITQRAVEPPAAVSTVVRDGFTYTAPSLYLAVVGTAEVSDSCGPQQPVLTNPTIAIPAGGLSTISYELPIGATFAGPRNAVAHTKPLNLDDLACPTFGFSDPLNVTKTYSGGDTAVIEVRTVGPPWNPVIVPPPEFLKANDKWSCSQFEDESSPWVITYGIFDPPIALTKQAGLITEPAPPPGGNDPVTTEDPKPTKSAFGPQPVETMPGNNDPAAETGGPGNDPTPSEPEVPANTPTATPAPVENNPPSENTPDDPSQPENPGNSNSPPEGSDPPANPGPTNPTDPQDPSGSSDPQNPPNPQNPPSNPNPGDPENASNDPPAAAPAPAGPGSVIASAIGASPASPAGGEAPSRPLAVVTTTDAVGLTTVIPVLVAPTAATGEGPQDSPKNPPAADSGSNPATPAPEGSDGSGSGSPASAGPGSGGSSPGGSSSEGSGSGSNSPNTPNAQTADLTTTDLHGATVILPPGLSASPHFITTTGASGKTVTRVVATDKSGSEVTLLPLTAPTPGPAGTPGAGSGASSSVVVSTDAQGSLVASTVAVPATDADGKEDVPENTLLSSYTDFWGAEKTRTLLTGAQGSVTATWTGEGQIATAGAGRMEVGLGALAGLGVVLVL